LQRDAATGLAALFVLAAGCGGEPPRTDAQLEQDAKVQALMKEGKSIGQIRAILKGEPDPTQQKKQRRKK
jgi:cytochrome c556